MARKLTAMEFREKLGHWLARVEHAREEFTITRRNVPVARLVPADGAAGRSRNPRGRRNPKPSKGRRRGA